jgi:hypothetical protein
MEIVMERWSEPRLIEVDRSSEGRDWVARVTSSELGVPFVGRRAGVSVFATPKAEPSISAARSSPLLIKRGEARSDQARRTRGGHGR